MVLIVALNRGIRSARLYVSSEVSIVHLATALDEQVSHMRTIPF
jgi:hypothetical protein